MDIETYLQNLIANHECGMVLDFREILVILKESESQGKIKLYSFDYSLSNISAVEEASYFFYLTSTKKGYVFYINRMGIGIKEDADIFKFSHRRLYSKKYLSHTFFGENDLRSGEFFNK